MSVLDFYSQDGEGSWGFPAREERGFGRVPHNHGRALDGQVGFAARWKCQIHQEIQSCTGRCWQTRAQPLRLSKRGKNGT